MLCLVARQRDECGSVLMNHQSCEVEKKVDLDEEELVSGMKNLNSCLIVFVTVEMERTMEMQRTVMMKVMRVRESTTCHAERREDDEEEEPTKGTKIREEEEVDNDSSFDFEDFQIAWYR